MPLQMSLSENQNSMVQSLRILDIMGGPFDTKFTIKRNLGLKVAVNMLSRYRSN